MKDRQKYWLDNGYTKEQIENHLRFERRKSKESRDRKKRNNEKNKELIKAIKDDLLGKEFDNKKIITISPTVDGKGFYYKVHCKYEDGSEGDFRYFYPFGGYNKQEFIEDITIMI